MHPSTRSLGVALGLCFAISFSSACALLVPPSWRSEFDIGLFGPIDGKRRAREAETTALLDPDQQRLRMQQLAEAIQRDRGVLIELVAAPGAFERSPADDPELRRIVERLPELQDELQALERSPIGDAESSPVPR